MIKAEHSWLHEKLLGFYFERIFRSQFHALLVSGVDHLSELDPRRSYIAIANHSNWWDGFVVFFLTRLLPGYKHYLMMEAQNLEKYSAFRKLGVFGVDIDDPRDARRGVSYATSLLRQNAAFLWLFPQGRLRPAREPLKFLRGAAVIARRAGNCSLLPLALRYEFTTEQKPLALVKIGTPLNTPHSFNEDLVTKLLVRIDADVLSCDFSSYSVMMSAGISINKRWEYVRHLLRGGRGEFRPDNTYKA